jgi:hypothetical protein
MTRWSGRVAALTAVLVAGLLIEAAPATAAPAAVAAEVPRPSTAGPVPAVVTVVGPAPAQRAQSAFGTAGSLVAVIGSSVAGDADRPVPTASLVKLYLAEGILDGARAVGTPVPPEDLARIEAMLTASDDPSASQLWVTYDGPAVLLDVATRYGLTATTPPAPDPGAWGSSRTSAADLERFFTALPVVAHPDDARFLLDALQRATPAGDDGFDQSFGLLGPGRVPGSAVKQGWMCCTDGVRHLHSVGIAGGQVVVLLAEFPTDVDWPTARAALDAAAAAVSR